MVEIAIVTINVNWIVFVSIRALKPSYVFLNFLWLISARGLEVS
jgi:hypothetical protein